MPQSERIPVQLLPSAKAAVTRINAERGREFALTGVVDTSAALSAKPAEPLEFGVVRCDGETCEREQVRVTSEISHYSLALVDVENAGIPALLDPPIGVRRT